MAPNLQKLCGRLVRQGLFEVKQLELIYREWRCASPRDRDSVDSFAQFLVLRGHVTVDRLQPSLNGLQQPQLNMTPMPRDDAEFDVELVPVRNGFDRRDLAIASLGILAGAIVATLIAFFLSR